MRVAAPGKVLLTGAYAVLEGAPALVVAVDRHAIADTSREERASMEVREALGRDYGPSVDVSALHDGGSKLGLGSSAAALVATLGAIRLERGDDLSSPSVRDELFAEARGAHERAQRGGSGVDVAASVYGGVLRYVRGGSARPVSLPTGIVWSVFWSGVSARTSDLRARVDALRARDERAWRARFDALTDASRAAARACDESNAEALLSAARARSPAPSRRSGPQPTRRSSPRRSRRWTRSPKPRGRRSSPRERAAATSAFFSDSTPRPSVSSPRRPISRCTRSASRPTPLVCTAWKLRNRGRAWPVHPDSQGSTR